jgi:hypothetical protein
MAINGLGAVVLAVFGVCVVAVTLALFVPPILSSAPVHEFLEWLPKAPPQPCACEGPTFSNG